MEPTIRPATPSDLPQIHQIYTWYVANTVISFLVNPPPVSYISSRYYSSLEQNMPYLVAVEPTSDKSERVVGYTYASGFRSFMLGYIRSVEMTIFVDPEHRGRGLGNALMKELLGQLKGRLHVLSEAPEEGEEKVRVEREVKQLFAIMAVDEEGDGKGLKDWYAKWGFEVSGRLRKVGFKNGRELDTLYMQREV
jgi:L-amino acid N-acyltransferase YncA